MSFIDLAIFVTLIEKDAHLRKVNSAFFNFASLNIKTSKSDIYNLHKLN